MLFVFSQLAPLVPLWSAWESSDQTLFRHCCLFWLKQIPSLPRRSDHHHWFHCVEHEEVVIRLHHETFSSLVHGVLSMGKAWDTVNRLPVQENFHHFVIIGAVVLSTNQIVWSDTQRVHCWRFLSIITEILLIHCRHRCHCDKHGKGVIRHLIVYRLERAFWHHFVLSGALCVEHEGDLTDRTQHALAGLFPVLEHRCQDFRQHWCHCVERMERLTKHC